MKCINNATTCIYYQDGQCLDTPKPKHIPGYGTVCMSIKTGGGD
ncbi:MAG: hypothetical protein AAGU32_07340 [Bacillota bacterium]